MMKFNFYILTFFLVIVGMTEVKAEIDDEKENNEAQNILTVKEKTLTLPMGLSRTLEFPYEVKSVQVTDPNLFDFKRIQDGDKFRKLLIIPKNPGYTDMTIVDPSGSPQVKYIVRVTREDVGLIISQLEELLGDVEGLKIKSVGGTVILDGDILLPKDMIRVIRVVDALKDRDPKKKEIPIKTLATISKITMNIIAERIEREVGSPEITVRVLNNNIILEGTAQSVFEAERAVEIAKSYIPEVFVEKSKGEDGEIKPKAQYGGVAGGVPTIVDLLRIAQTPSPPPASDIKITMNYVELVNEYSKTFDFHWSPLAQEGGSIQYSSALGEITANLVATVTSLLPKLNSARDHGHAKILKQETIIVKDKADQPATIESSVDYYARNINERGEGSLQAIPIQNATKVKAATISGSDSIDLGIQITLNTLQGFNRGAPIVAKNSLQTQVTIKNGDSAALGGYAIDQALAGYNREPNSPSGGVGQTTGGSTPLFNLKRSKQYQHDKRQFVIFVTPEILRTASSGTEDITRKFRMNAGER